MTNKVLQKITVPGATGKKTIIEDEFLSLDDIVPVKKDAARRAAKEAGNEIELLINEKKWDDVLALFYPLAQKLPEICSQTEDTKIREKLAFVLGQINRFDDAIAELKTCIAREPDNFFLHNSLAYTAYNSLYAAKNREIFLNGKPKKERIALAHVHFGEAQRLRPDGITNFYRQGMLYRQIENKSVPAMPLFLKAVENWDKLTLEEKKDRHQQRKNFVKSLYQGASVVLEQGSAKQALEMIRRCISEDEKSAYVSLIFKYFALGKVLYHMNRFQDARDALEFAMKCRTDKPSDFINELLARTYLGLEKPEKAFDVLRRVPPKRQRPYICWTLSDILISSGEFEAAQDALVRSLDRDHMSRHKTLIRLSRLNYLQGNYPQARAYAEKACGFFNTKWGTVYFHGLFWQSLSAFRCSRIDESRNVAARLKSENPGYPGLEKLLAMINQK